MSTFDRTVRVSLLTVGGLLVLLLGAELIVAVQQPSLWATLGWDFHSYLDAARRWTAGDGFYRPSDVAAPFEIRPGAILYPPSILPLLLPFLVLPAVLWWLIPIGLTVWAVAYQRPKLWAWVAILACFALGFVNAMVYWYGTPTIWFVAAVAVATRWPPAGALILMKPTLAPLALIGVGHRRWWITAGAIVALNLVLLPLLLDWLAVMAHVRGPRANPLYSIIDVPMLLVPLIAWTGSPQRDWRRPWDRIRGISSHLSPWSARSGVSGAVVESSGNDRPA